MKESGERVGGTSSKTQRGGIGIAIIPPGLANEFACRRPPPSHRQVAFPEGLMDQIVCRLYGLTDEEGAAE